MYRRIFSIKKANIRGKYRATESPPVCAPPLFALTLPLVLASASPRRQQFLREWGVACRVVRPAGVEPLPLPDEAPETYALRAAAAKARAVRATLPPPAPGIVLGADTVVAVACAGQRRILGKPRDAAEALSMLRTLRGREHTVISAVSLLTPNGDTAFYDSARVCFHDWDDAVLAAYVRTGEPLDKAGGYAIQGQGAFLVRSISGSWATVVGLPVDRLAALLWRRGLLVPASR